MTEQKVFVDKFWSVEGRKTYVCYDQFETYEKAEAAARQKAYEEGKDYLILAPIAVAKAPLAVNEIQVAAVT